MRTPSSARWGGRAGASTSPPSPWGRALDSPALLVLQAGTLLLLTIAVATRYWQDHVWLGWAMLAVAAVAWTPELAVVRARRWWFVYVAGIFAYTLLRSYADEAGMPLQLNYPIDVDHALFFGGDPAVWLQDHFFDTGRVTPLDVLAVVVHWSFFVAPHALAVAIFIWRREYFARYVMLVVGTMYAGLALFFLLPTAPPWLAAQDGLLPRVYRVMDFVGGSVNAGTYRSVYASLGEPNSVAAMPSIHMAVTFAMFLWTRDHYRRGSWVLLAYCAIMGVSLVYLAEHYVVDLAAGIVCATLCYLLVRRYVPATTT